MLEFDFDLLSGLGLTPALAARAVQAAAESPGRAQGGLCRITEVHRETLTLHDGAGEHRARPSPRLVRDLAAAGSALVVGDWVLVDADPYGERWLHARVPPLSHIVRRDGYGQRHAVVSNVDVALLVMGLDSDFSANRLERYLALVDDHAILPVVVLTKRDVAAPTAALLEAKLAALAGRVPPHVDVIAVDATQPAAAAALAGYLGRGRTLVMLGSSGAGKSTLTNSLLGESVQDTGRVRESDGRGMHTTTARSLHRLPGGACVIDTPGVRTLRPDLDEATLADRFADIEALASRCRFRDCRHGEEPGCAVREGVDPARLRNYHKLLREARRDTMTALDRQRQLSEWKARGRAARQKLALKRGAPTRGRGPG
jgi:ribosome biogenesis GTPase